MPGPRPGARTPSALRRVPGTVIWVRSSGRGRSDQRHHRHASALSQTTFHRLQLVRGCRSSPENTLLRLFIWHSAYHLAVWGALTAPLWSRGLTVIMPFTAQTPPPR